MSKISKKAQALKSVISGASEDPADDIVPNARSTDQHQLGDAAKQAAAAQAAEAQAAATQEKFGSLPGTDVVAEAASAKDDPFGADLFGSPSVPTRDGNGAGLIPGTDPADVINKDADSIGDISSNTHGINTDIGNAGNLVQDNSPGGGSFVPNLESGGRVVETELVDRSTTPYFRETYADGSQTVTLGPTQLVEANDRALADGRKIVDAATGEESHPVDLFASDQHFGGTENYVSEAVLSSVLGASQKVQEGRTDAEANLEAEANAAADEVIFGDDNFFADDTHEFFPETNDDDRDPLRGDGTTEEDANKEFDSLFPDAEKKTDGGNDGNTSGNTDENTDGSNDEDTDGGNASGGNASGGNDDSTDENTDETETDEGSDADNEADGSADAENSTSTPSGDDPTSAEALANRKMVEEMGLNGENRTRNDNLIDPVENDEIEGEGTGYVPPISIPEQDIVQPPESLDAGRQVPTDKGDIDYGPDYDDTDTPGGGSIPDSGGIHASGADVLAPLHSADLIADAPAAANPAIAPEVAATASDAGAATTLSVDAAKAPEMSDAIATPDLGAQAIDAIGADLDVDSAFSFTAEAPDAVEADLDIDDVDVSE